MPHAKATKRFQVICQQKNFDVLIAIIGLGVIGLFFTFLNNPPALDDGLRHLAMGKVYAEQGIQATGGWGVFFYEGLFAHLNTDPWFLFDVLLMPLAGLPTVLALKLIILTSIALLLVTFIIALRSLKVSPAISSVCIALLLFGHRSFTGRLLIARPFLLMTSIAILLLICILQRRFIYQAILLGIALLLSQLFVFPLAIALVGIAWLAAMGEWKSVRRSILSIALGFLIGLSFHSHPIGYLRYVLPVFLRIPFLKYIGLGSEMSSGIVSGETIFLLAGLIILLAIFAFHRKRLTKKIALRSGLMLTGSLAIIFLGVFIFWMRGIDIAWPFLLLALAHICTLCPKALKDLSHALLPARSLPPLLILIVALLVSVNVDLGYDVLHADSTHALAPFAQDLAAIPAGSRILNVDWDSFPIFVSVRPDLRYATGIDPSFTYLVDPTAFSVLHRVYTSDFQQPVSDDTAASWLHQLLAQYSGDYLLVDSSRHVELIKALAHVPQLEKMSDDPNLLTVFKIH